MYPSSSWNTWGQTPIFYGASGSSSAVVSASACGTTGVAPTFYNFGAGSQPWGLSISSSSSSLLVGVSPTGATAGGSIVSIPLTGAPTPSTIISGMAGAPISVVAIRQVISISLKMVRAPYRVLMRYPPGQTPTSDAGLTRIDPSLGFVSGVAADSKGNVYISDNQAGVYLYPNGATSSSAAFLITSVPAQGEVAFVGNSGLFVPTTTPPQSNVPADVVQVSFSTAQFGQLGVNAKTPAQANVAFSFNATTTPATIEVIEAGKSTPDFSIVSGVSGTCLSPQLQAPYGPGSGNSAASCPVAISFAPQAAGNVSATLVMLDAKNNLLASIPLTGTGMSAAVQVTSTVPYTPVTIGSSLVTPSQIAVDAAGNLYVADSGLKAVEMYPAGSGSATAGTSVGTGLQAPTGVAVDGAGDVFIADSGNVYRNTGVLNWRRLECQRPDYVADRSWCPGSTGCRRSWRLVRFGYQQPESL